MLKLLIVDDEEDVLEGLSGMVDWLSLGFFVVGKLRDGREAIEFIQKFEVDIILTDIKMTFSSGLDVAKFVCENKPKIKVVLLSGHQEFVLAKEAITYNVAHYLLKPTDLDEIVSVFGELSVQIEKEKKKLELYEYREQHNKTLVPLLQEQLFINLLTGGVVDKEAVQKKLSLIGIPVDPEAGRCSVMDVKWFHTNKVELPYEKKREYIKAVNLAFMREKEHIQYTVIHTRDDHFLVIAIALDEMQEDVFVKKIEQSFLHHQKSLASVLGLSVQLKGFKHYRHLMDMCSDPNVHENRLPYKPSSASGTAGLSALKDSIIEVLTMMWEHPEERLEAAIEELRGLNDMETIRYWCKKYFDSMIDILDGEPERVIITKAKQFVAMRYNEDLSLEDVAEAIGLNPVYFSRLFKQETGETFSDFKIRIRMEKAIEYLKDPKYKIYEICYLIGYKNVKYFYKLFKNYTQLTPSEFRERNEGRTR